MELSLPSLPRLLFTANYENTASKVSKTSVEENSTMPRAIRVEYAHQRKIRDRNKRIYRVAHWPIWIWVFFLAPGPLTFDLFAHGGSVRNILWLFFVLVATGIAGVFGQLPGVEPRPYILRFCEDKPNPLYRRICYTFAWNALLSFALLNLIGLIVAVAAGAWYLKQIYRYAYLPVFLAVIVLALFELLPRVRRSTKGEGMERRYFYGALWSVSFAQFVLLLLWKTLPRTHAADICKLIAFLLALQRHQRRCRLRIAPAHAPHLAGRVHGRRLIVNSSEPTLTPPKHIQPSCPSGPNIRVMAEASVRHRLVSSTSCLRPCFVNV